MRAEFPDHRLTRTVRSCTVILALTGLTGAGADGFAAEDVQVRVGVSSASKRSCGAESLYFCLRLCQSDTVRLAELEAKLPIGYQGVSAAEIAKVCHSLGVPAEGVRGTLSTLDGLAAPCILHVNDDHFVAFVRLEGERVVLFDSTIGLLDCSQEWFGSRYQWRGDALVLGERHPRALLFLQSKGFLLLSGGLFLVGCGAHLLLAQRQGRGSISSA